MQSRAWDRRAPGWADQGASGLGAVIEAVLALADAGCGQSAVDLGCGTGQLTLPLARRGVEVTAVDFSSSMIDHLLTRAAEEGIDGVTGVVSAIEHVDLPERSVDLVVSNYALHHLRDREKEILVAKAVRWLRPGGRIIIGDMMFGRGSTRRDRDIIRSKVSVLARRGPAGWWRIVKAAVRFTLRLGERPATMPTWCTYFESAGLIEVSALSVVAEAAIVSGAKPRGEPLALLQGAVTHESG